MSNKTKPSCKLSCHREQPVCHISPQDILAWQHSVKITNIGVISKIMVTYDIKSLLDCLFPAALSIRVLWVQVPSLRPS